MEQRLQSPHEPQYPHLFYLSISAKPDKTLWNKFEEIFAIHCPICWWFVHVCVLAVYRSWSGSGIEQQIAHLQVVAVDCRGCTIWFFLKCPPCLGNFQKSSGRGTYILGGSKIIYWCYANSSKYMNDVEACLRLLTPIDRYVRPRCRNRLVWSHIIDMD
jgi:hypothetical protein